MAIAKAPAVPAQRAAQRSYALSRRELKIRALLSALRYVESEREFLSLGVHARLYRAHVSHESAVVPRSVEHAADMHIQRRSALGETAEPLRLAVAGMCECCLANATGERRRHFESRQQILRCEIHRSKSRDEKRELAEKIAHFAQGLTVLVMAEKEVLRRLSRELSGRPIDVPRWVRIRFGSEANGKQRSQEK